MDDWLENMSEMMHRQELRNEEDKLEHQLRQRKIDATIETAELKYGRQMTPSTKTRQPAPGSKRAGIDVDR